MAKPTGALTMHTDYPYSVGAVTEATAEYMYIPLRLPTIPDRWASSTIPRIFMRSCRVNVTSLTNVSNTDAGNIAYYFNGTKLIEHEIAGTGATTWSTALAADNIIWGNSFPLYSGDEAIKTGKYLMLQLAMWKDAGSTFDAHAIHVRFRYDLEYEPFAALTTEPDQATQPATLTDRTTAANHLYKPNRACSAWHVKEMLAHTLNKCTYTAKWGTTVPLFGGDGP